MTADIRREALDRFGAWLEWPIVTRDRRLAEELVDQPDLLAEVRRLIRADAGAAMLPTEPPEPVDVNAAASLPDRVGVYRLIEQIGRGGMGMVFRAERDDGVFAQTVAVKLIRRTLFAAGAIEQFARERQILARLRHPHIAQLFDGGVTAEHESYIVLELIDGPPITTHCEAQALPLEARLALMSDVCGAVQFAHQQLVVHADIKPSNVVVDAHYGVKLLDFGIARMVDAAVETGTSSQGQTPAFASPQQAAGEAPTPADDVYALGKLIDMLAGSDRAQAELGAVIRRATASEPEERYATAADLAADLARFRDGRPVRARPASRARAARMYVQRHWLGVGLATLAMVALVSATLISSLLYLDAEAARLQSEHRFQENRQLSRYLLTDLTDALQHYPGTSQLRHDLALKGRSYLELLSNVPGAPVDMRLEIAEGYTKTGTILGKPGVQNLGNPRLAKQDLALAETILRRLMATSGNRPDVTLALANTVLTQASIAHVTDNDVPRALRLYSDACHYVWRVLVRMPRDAAARMAEYRCLIGLVNVYDYEARFADMKAPLDGAITALHFVPDGTERALALGNAYTLRGDYFYYGGPRPSALAEYARAADVLDRALTREPDVRLLDRLAWADYNYGEMLDEVGRHEDGLAAVERGVAAADRMLYFEKSPRAHQIANSLHLQRAMNLSSLKRYPEAIAEGDAALAAFRAAAAAAPDDFEAARSVPANMRGVGEIYWDAGRHAEACTLFARTRDAWDALARRHKMTGFDATDEKKTVARLLARCAKTKAI